MRKLAKAFIVLCALLIIPISGPLLNPTIASECGWGNCGTPPPIGGGGPGGGLGEVNFDTGWISRSDWTNTHLGSDTTKNTDSNIHHYINQSITNLLVKVLISPDGTDGNSIEISNTSKHPGGGYTIYQVDYANLKVQTNSNGIPITADDGSVTVIDTEDWYYRVKVYRLGYELIFIPPS